MDRNNQFGRAVGSLLGTLVGIGGCLLGAGEAAAYDCGSLAAARRGGAAGCDAADVAAIDDAYTNPRVRGRGNGDLIGFFTGACEDGGDLCAEPLRCMDGTRPIYYVDPARDPINSPSDPISNGWIFYVQGGGSCGDGVSCGNKYTSSERSEMSSAQAKRFRSERGIFADPPGTTNLFTNYNRVWIHKCSYDRFTGSNTNAGEPSPYNVGDTVDLFSHGRRIWSAVFDALTTNHPSLGLGYSVSSPCQTSTCDGTCPASGCDGHLPTLANATHVMLIGWSGGGHGMIQQLDSLAAELSTIAVNADIRGVIDARFMPSVEVQGAFWEDSFDEISGAAVPDGINDYLQCGAAGIASSPVCTDNGDGIIDETEALSSGSTVYNADWFTPGELPQNPGCPACDVTYGTDEFAAGNRLADGYDFMGTQPDVSCLAAHPNAPSICYDYTHVLLNHVATPFMLRFGMRDQAFWGPDSHALGADDPSYFYTVSAYVDRSRVQLKNYIEGFFDNPLATHHSELATGADPSWVNEGLPTDAPWPMAVFAPDSQVHAGVAGRDDTFFDGCMAPSGSGPVLSAHDALFDWITYDVDIRAYDDGANWTTAATCP